MAPRIRGCHRLERQEQLGCLAVCDALEGIQILDRDQVGGRITVVDRSEHPFDGLTFTLGHGQLLELVGFGDFLDRLRLTFGLEDAGGLDALRTEDLGPLLTLGLGDDRTTFALGLHLPVHGLRDVGRGSIRWISTGRRGYPTRRSPRPGSDGARC